MSSSQVRRRRSSQWVSLRAGGAGCVVDVGAAGAGVRIRLSAHQASGRAASTGRAHTARAACQSTPHCISSGDSCALKAPPPISAAEYSPIMGATLAGDWRLMRPGIALCTRATPTPHSPAVPISKALLAGARRNAQPRAMSSSAPHTADRALRRCKTDGASQPPTPIKAMGSRVSQLKLRKSMPVACWMVWPSGPGAVKNGRRLMVTSTTTASHSKGGTRGAEGELGVIKSIAPSARAAGAGE